MRGREGNSSLPRRGGEEPERRRRRARVRARPARPLHPRDGCAAPPDRRYGDPPHRRLPEVELAARSRGVGGPPAYRAHPRTRGNTLPRDGQCDVRPARHAPGDGVYRDGIPRAPPEEILRAAVSGARLAGGVSGYLEEGQKANFMVINPSEKNISFSRDIRTTIVKRLDSSSICQTVLTMQ